MLNEVLNAALQYHQLGLSLVPIRPKSKKPACRTWEPFQNVRASEQLVREWFGRTKNGMAVILGAVSGDLFCRDFDRMDAYERWAAENPIFARTLPTAATARGRHVYCRSQFGRIEKRDDGELRGAGYCLLPPSIHPDGVPYRWIIPLGELIPMVDLSVAGFLRTHATERTEYTETTEGTENTENTEFTDEHRGRQMPMADLSRELVFSNLNDTIEPIIAKTIPLQFGNRNRAVFELARGLKSIPALNGADPNELEPYVRRWHSLALPYVRTEPFEETWIDFLRAWPRVNFPLGADPMTEILHRAIAHAGGEWSYELPGLRLLASLCRELQRTAGDAPFYLSCRKAGELLNVDHTTASRWLWYLEHDKVILTVKKGTRGKGVATRFRFVKPM